QQQHTAGRPQKSGAHTTRIGPGTDGRQWRRSGGWGPSAPGASRYARRVPDFEVVVKAGIVHDGRILVLDPSEAERHGEHDLPGGRVEFDEDPLHALHREVFEETGLTIDPVGPVRMWSVIRSNGNQMV